LFPTVTDLRQDAERRMRPYSFKEKAKITVGAVTALVIVGWLAVIAFPLDEEGARPTEAVYGCTATPQAAQMKLGPYWVLTASKPSETKRTVGVSSLLPCERKAMPVLRHRGHSSSSFHSSVIGQI
jgi:hypothetical protein